MFQMNKTTNGSNNFMYKKHNVFRYLWKYAVREYFVLIYIQVKRLKKTYVITLNFINKIINYIITFKHYVFIFDSINKYLKQRQNLY